MHTNSIALARRSTRLAGLALLLTAFAPSSGAQSNCPSVSVTTAGCTGSTGEKPALSFLAPLTGWPGLLIEIDHTNVLGQAFVWAGPATTFTTVNGCSLGISDPLTAGPYAPDATGHSYLLIPLSAALAGLDVRFQPVEVDSGAPPGVSVGDASDVEFTTGCVSDQQLLDMVVLGAPPFAAQAYAELYARGPSTIPAIATKLASLPAVGSSNPLQGVVPVTPSSSYIEVAVDPAIALCYLLESFHRDSFTPWGAPRVLHAFSTPDLDGVVSQYLSWVAGLADYQPATVQAAPAPLYYGYDLWYGPPTDDDADPFADALADGGSIRVTGGSTPAGDPPAISPHSSGDPGALSVAPATPGGPTPYNCLANALGYDDRWVQPIPPDAPSPLTPATMEEILEDHDYEEGGPTKGCPCILLIWHKPIECPPEKGRDGAPDMNLPPDGQWVHAMGTSDGGETYTSKNGQGKEYKVEKEALDEFLDKHYPTTGVDKNGQKICFERIMKHFCKCGS